MRRVCLGVLAAGVVGCSAGSPAATGPRSITWAEYQAMPPMDRADPYTQTLLDDDAKAKLAAQSSKKSRR